MSLWEKWEREKLEKQGIKVPRQSDVEIHEMREKPSFKKQIGILFLAITACLALFFAAVTYFNGANWWSNTYFARLLAERGAYREAVAENQ